MNTAVTLTCMRLVEKRTNSVRPTLKNIKHDQHKEFKIKTYVNFDGKDLEIL